MKNVAYDSNPMYWTEYFGQKKPVELAKQFIAKGIDDERGLPRCIFISGPSGVGKTSYVRLLLRSFRCLNRQLGEYEPCGECENCTLGLDERLGGRAYGDTLWVQPGDRERGTLQSRVRDALAQASQGHTHTGQPDRDVLFVVFDEFQAFPSDLRQEVLLKAEVEQDNNNVCFIFVTMLEEKINLQERIALIRRSCPLKFRPFTVDEIKEYLQTKYPDAPLDTLEMVAISSENSPGLGLAYMEMIKQEDEEMLIDTTCQILDMATPTQRLHLWQSLEQEKDITEIRRILEDLGLYVSNQRLVGQLINDILASVSKSPTREQLFALEQLNQYLRNYGVLSLLSHLTPMIGVPRLVDHKLLESQSTLKYAL